MAKKLTQDEFIARARNTHNNKYDYSLVEYINSSTKVKVICPKHGVFEQIPNNHLRGAGCLKCKYENDRTLAYGIGYYDCEQSVFASEKDIKSYDCWRGMFVRCYSNKHHKKAPTYIGCSVCNEWHLFSNFKKWFDENYKEGMALDKDILIQGNKIYGPDTCCFVPQHINNLLTDHRSARGKYKMGVIYNERLNKFLARISINGRTSHVGCYLTEDEAFTAYSIAKKGIIAQTAKKAFDEGLISSRVYEALLKYEIKEY